MPKSKIEKEFQADEEGTVLVPKEIVSVPESAIKKAVKREMSDKQKENMLKMVEANKARWAKAREEKARAVEEERAKRLEEEKKLIEAGTHVRVKVTKKQYKPRTPKPLPLKRENEAKNDSSDDDDTGITETETDTGLSDTETEDERPKARKVRREMKKTLRVVEKVDAVLNQVQNPYLSMLSNRWR